MSIGRERAGQRALGAELDAPVEQPVVAAPPGRARPAPISTGARSLRDDAERVRAALHRRRLAEADDAVLGLDADEGAAPARRFVRAQATWNASTERIVIVFMVCWPPCSCPDAIDRIEVDAPEACENLPPIGDQKFLAVEVVPAAPAIGGRYGA